MAKHVPLMESEINTGAGKVLVWQTERSFGIFKSIRDDGNKMYVGGKGWQDVSLDSIRSEYRAVAARVHTNVKSDSIRWGNFVTIKETTRISRILHGVTLVINTFKLDELFGSHSTDNTWTMRINQQQLLLINICTRNIVKFHAFAHPKCSNFTHILGLIFTLFFINLYDRREIPVPPENRNVA